ncbi:Protein VTS1 [Ceratobasidium theobromae]|uniref:RNA-binding protein VTS1 n=1 Tax=Ceratobasidium theobromae TaxID=1582974 RepID=A0A5N5QPX1_9AGAM|nr:Protein VTS1 [Ceratobasidium theobromae]
MCVDGIAAHGPAAEDGEEDAGAHEKWQTSPNSRYGVARKSESESVAWACRASESPGACVAGAWVVADGGDERAAGEPAHLPAPWRHAPDQRAHYGVDVPECGGWVEFIIFTCAYCAAEAIDQWFENLQNYEATLEEMAAASLDVNFKEELSAIEQWFRVLSEAERTAALYSLLQHSTQVQIRFFITVLQQMARADPMTALLSPAVGASMQSQMEAKLASLGLKSPASPRTFLAPDNDAAATLAQQRARLKATNAAHRISAPGTLAADAARANVWSASALSQVAEGPDLLSPPPATRPKSTDFTGVAAQFRKGDDELSPMAGGNWASMVNTPVVPMFGQPEPSVDAAAAKLASWAGPVVQLDDARKFRRASNAKPEQPQPQPQPRPRQPAPPWPQRSPNRFQEDVPFVGPAMPMNMPMVNGFGMMAPAMPMPAFAMNSVEGLQAQLLAAQIAQLNAGFPIGMMPGLAPNQGPRSASGRSTASGRRSPKPPAAVPKEDDVDPNLLQDIPAWLRSLRLHKYTPNFEGMNWRDMVLMDEPALEAKGVAALGARRKMLKTFQTVREKMGIDDQGSKPDE